MTAKAKDDCIVYAIPITTFKPYVSQNQEVLNFLLESFATNSKNQADKQAKGLISDTVAFNENQFFPLISSNTFFMILSDFG